MVSWWFVKGKGATTGYEGTSSMASHNSPRCPRETISLNQEFNENYTRVSACEVASMKWRCDSTLGEYGMATHFNWMADNVKMPVFAYMYTETYKELTWEFITTFSDNLANANVEHRITFTLQGEFHLLSLQCLCDILAFVSAGVIASGNNHSTKISSMWELISTNHDTKFSKAKVASVENPMIHYFTMFLVNTIFGREHVGGMEVPEMCVLYTALKLNPVFRPNLGALMIAHFHCQAQQPAGTICFGSLITIIAHNLQSNCTGTLSSLALVGLPSTF